MKTKGGSAIRVMKQVSVSSSDSSQTWFRSPRLGDPDIHLPDIPAPGQINTAALEDALGLEDFIYALLDNDMLITIHDWTNREMEIVRSSPSMSEGTRNRPVYQDTNPTELRAFLGVLIMTGVRHDSYHIQ